VQGARAAAAAMVLRGQDAWRSHPIFRNLWRQAFPGLRLGAAAFVIYTVAETAIDWATPAPAHGEFNVSSLSSWTQDAPNATPRLPLLEAVAEEEH